MAANNGPYFLGTDAQSHMYPDFNQPAAHDAQMYALADGAVQAHQEHNQLANLVQAAEAATNANGFQTQFEDAAKKMEQEDQRKSARKRKREQGSDEFVHSDGEQVDDQIGGKKQKTATDARLAALSTSASALFRRPSASSKKYTRPPMSKLFTSLELAPEGFLQLQAAAKGYMLNPSYPDRRDTVGQRGKGDSELVKLRLWNCAKEFLEGEGNGLRFFGEDVLGDDGNVRSMVWPKDKNIIIGAVTPLLRRMVTNERQRQYAIESRKGGGEDEPDTPTASKTLRKSAAADAEASSIQALPPSTAPLESQALFHAMTGLNADDIPLEQRYDGVHATRDPSLQAHIDSLREQSGSLEEKMPGVFMTVCHHLRTHHHGATSAETACDAACEDQLVARIAFWLVDASATPFQSSELMKIESQAILPLLHSAYRLVRDIASRTVMAAPSSPLASSPTNANAALYHAPSSSLPPTLMLHISLLSPLGLRLAPRKIVRAHTCPYVHTAIQEATAQMGPRMEKSREGGTRVRVLSPEGLVEVPDDKAWDKVLEEIKKCEWMDGEAKVLVEL